MAEKNSTTTVTDQPKCRLMLPWKTRIVISILSLFTDASSCRDGTVDRRADRLFSTTGVKTPANSKSVRGVTYSDFTIDAACNLSYGILTPTASSSPDLPVIVFFHGGGFVHLAPGFKWYDLVCHRFAVEINAVVVFDDNRGGDVHSGGDAVVVCLWCGSCGGDPAYGGCGSRQSSNAKGCGVLRWCCRAASLIGGGGGGART